MKMLVVVFSILMSHMSFAQMKCEQVFNRNNSSAALEAAINNSITNLARFHMNLEKNKIAGTNTIATRELEEKYSVKLNSLISYLEQYKIMSRDELRQRIRLEITQLQHDNKDTEQELEEQKVAVVSALEPTKISRKAKFHKIAAGKYKMPNVKKEIEISNSFEMMDTLVTQMMWSRLQILTGNKNSEKINPSYFKNGAEAVTADIDGRQVVMQPDHPVESVSWYEVVKLIKSINILSKNGDAKIQKQIKSIISDHKAGDVYDLPTAAQWRFVMTKRGKAIKRYYDNLNDDLSKHAWFKENAEGESHAVAKLRPRHVDRQAFYDLEGNVSEWCKDWYNINIIGGKNPKGAKKGEYKVIHGGDWDNADFSLSVENEGAQEPELPLSTIGFRLVRTRPTY